MKRYQFLLGISLAVLLVNLVNPNRATAENIPTYLIRAAWMLTIYSLDSTGENPDQYPVKLSAVEQSDEYRLNGFAYGYSISPALVLGVEYLTELGVEEDNHRHLEDTVGNSSQIESDPHFTSYQLYVRYFPMTSFLFLQAGLVKRDWNLKVESDFSESKSNDRAVFDAKIIYDDIAYEFAIGVFHEEVKDFGVINWSLGLVYITGEGSKCTESGILVNPGNQYSDSDLEREVVFLQENIDESYQNDTLFRLAIGLSY